MEGTFDASATNVPGTATRQHCIAKMFARTTIEDDL